MYRPLRLLQVGYELTFVSRFAARNTKKTTTKKQPDQVVLEKDIRYNPWQAIRLMKAYSHVAFEETVDLCVHLNVNPKVGDQLVRGTAVLPAGTGNKVKVAVLCPDGFEDAAKEAGADIVDSNVILEQVAPALI